MWETLSVGQFITLYDIEMNENLNIIDKQVAMVAAVENKPVESYNKMRYGDLLKIYNEKLAFFNALPECKAVDYVQTPKNEYKFSYELNEMTAGQYISISMMDGNILNLNKIAACFMLPMKGKKYHEYGVVPHDVVAEDLLDARFIDVYGCMLFFCPLLTDLIKDIVTSSDIHPETIKMMIHLLNIGDGYLQPNQLQTLKILA